MGERKVLNKYYPPDFDPAKLPRRRRPKNEQIKVRMMLPMSIRCGTCGNYIYKGTKFNSRKEDVIGETYLGIQIFRFYFKCTKCSAELTMKTDPQNSDYIVESGASRNYEPWRAEDEEADGQKRKRDDEEMGDAMKSLENRTLDSKREMDIMAALDEMKSMRSRHAGVSSEELLKALQRSGEQKEEELHAEDEALIKSIYQVPKSVILRIDDEDIDEDEDLLDPKPSKDETLDRKNKKMKLAEGLGNPTDSLTKKSIFDIPKDKDAAVTSKNPKFLFKSTSVTVKVTKKPVPPVPVPCAAKQEKDVNNNEQNSVLQALGQNYDSDED
ncbi:hypothetical protein ACHQM5_028211 [Ranunculus cassubicifolius]